MRIDPADDLSERQRHVLSAALEVLVEAGDRLTMTAVARRARCSKETLYKWFGDRQGLLTATVQWQAAKVRPPVFDSAQLTRQGLERALIGFAQDWLTVICGEISIGLNRLAVARAGPGRDALGRIVLENGPFALSRRLSPLLGAARDLTLIAFPSEEAAFGTFFGLVVRDTQIRLLLGDAARPNEVGIAARAREATAQFMALYAVRSDTADKIGPPGP